MSNPTEITWQALIDSLTPPHEGGGLGDELKTRIAAGEVVRVTMDDGSTKEFFDAQEFGDWFALLQAGP